jgi:hypothetical protein
MSARIIAAALWVLAGVAAAGAQEKKPQSKEERDRAEYARLQKLLDERIDVKGLSEKKTTLGKFLSDLEARLPKEKKVPLRLDKAGLGKDLDKVADAPIEGLTLKDASLRMVLRKALSKSPVEVAFGLQPAVGVVVTRPRLAVHPLSYPVGDVVRRLPGLLPEMARLHFSRKDPFADVDRTDGGALLMRLLEVVELDAWESLEIVNGTKLVALASPDHHQEIESLIEAIRRLDLSVVMNARLYEIDAADYAKRVAPLLKKDKEGNRPAVVHIDQKTFDFVVKQKVVVESDFVKLRPYRASAFLSKQTAFRYAAEPRGGQKAVGAGLSGVSFRVKARVSPDRRFLRLEIAQQVNQLVKIDKVQKLDLMSGKAVAFEAPNLRRSSLVGTVDVPDGGALLMPVDFLPAAKGKAWVLAARPIIWIEEEERERRRQGGKPFSPAEVWKSAVSNEAVEAAAFRR